MLFTKHLRPNAWRDWLPWFAWYPVVVYKDDDTQVRAWWERVEYHREVNYSDIFTRYRLPEGTECPCPTTGS